MHLKGRRVALRMDNIVRSVSELSGEFVLNSFIPLPSLTFCHVASPFILSPSHVSLLSQSSLRSHLRFLMTCLHTALIHLLRHGMYIIYYSDAYLCCLLSSNLLVITFSYYSELPMRQISKAAEQ